MNSLIILVTGDRNWYEWETVENTLKAVLKVTDLAAADVTLTHGDARGLDTLAGEVAEELGMTVEIYPAEWNRYGKGAGPIRNRQMLDTDPDIVIGFHDSIKTSSGTRDCLREARERKLPTTLIRSFDTALEKLLRPTLEEVDA